MLLADIINYGLYGLALGSLAVGALLGFKRGAGKQTVKLVLLMISIVVSFWICLKIYPLVFNLVAGRSVTEICGLVGVSFDEATASIINSVDSESAAYILAVPLTLVLVPLISMILLIILTALCLIPSVFLCGMLGFGNRFNNLITRAGGAVLGAIEGFLALCMVLAPLVGIVNVAGEAVKNAEEKYPEYNNSQAIGKIYHANVDKAENNLVFKFVDSNFGYIYDEFTNVKMEDHEIQMEKVASDCFEIFVLYGELGETDFASPTDRDKEIIEAMIKTFGKDEYMTTIASGIVKSASTAMLNGNIQLNVEEPLSSFLNSLIAVFSDSNKNTIEADLTTALNIYSIVADSGAFVSMDLKDKSMFEAFLVKDENGVSVINLICNELDANPRFHHVSESLSDFAMDLLFEGLDIGGGDVKQTLDDVKGTLNNIVNINKEDYATEEEYKADVNKELDSTLKEHGIELEEEQLSQVTDFVVTEFEGKEEITDMDLAQFMGKYYDVYGTLPTLPDGSTPELPEGTEIPDGIIPEGTEVPTP